MQALVLLAALACGKLLEAARLPPEGTRALLTHAEANSSRSSEPRRVLIANGAEAPAGRWPYVCALGRAPRGADTVEYDVQQCGATLIHPRVVLTAAHCAANEWGFSRPGLAVLCNATLLGSSGGGAQFRRVEQSRIHPDSLEAIASAVRQGTSTSKQLPDTLSGFTTGDVALLLLDSPIQGIQPVKVATPQDWQGIDRVGQELHTVGWGAVEEGSNPSVYPRSLQEASLPLVSPDKCESEYQADAVSPDGQYYSSTINSSVSICAGFTVGAKSLPCEGDSGGPLLYAPDLGNPSNHLQVGIVSGGAGECGGPSLPVVFSRADHYQPWIEAALKEVDNRQRLPETPKQAGPQQLLPLLAPAGGRGGDAAVGSAGSSGGQP